MRSIHLSLMVIIGACLVGGGCDGDKEAVVVQTCESASSVAFEENEASADLLASVETFDGIRGSWSATDACVGSAISVEIVPCDHGAIQVLGEASECESLALVDAQVVVGHPDLGTLTFAMSGTLNEPGAWNVVDINGTAAEDGAIRLSMNLDSDGAITATMMVTDGSDDESCQLQDWATN